MEQIYLYFLYKNYVSISVFWSALKRVIFLFINFSFTFNFIFLQISNSIGSVSGLVQLILFAYYYFFGVKDDSTTENDASKPTENASKPTDISPV